MDLPREDHPVSKPPLARPNHLTGPYPASLLAFVPRPSTTPNLQYGKSGQNCVSGTRPAGSQQTRLTQHHRNKKYGREEICDWGELMPQ